MGEDTSNERLEIYKLLVEMADRVSQRRQAANNFYLSVNTVLVGGSAYLRIISPKILSAFVISSAGLAICVLWWMNVESYKTLNAAKFKVINETERELVAQPFEKEWGYLDPDGDGKRHRPFHKVERLIPGVFGLIYITELISLLC